MADYMREIYTSYIRNFIQNTQHENTSDKINCKSYFAFVVFFLSYRTVTYCTIQYNINTKDTAYYKKQYPVESRI